MPHTAKERHRKKQRAYRLQLKLEMIKAYGGKCKFCGEKDPDVLVLDHINDDGNLDRKANGHKGGANMYVKLRNKGWPQGYLQLLCANCNVRKEMKRRRMPSKSKAQRNFMAAAAHNPKFAKKAGVPVSVAKEFNAADKGKKFKSGGDVADKSKLKKIFKGKDTYGEELKEAKAIKSGKITPKEYAKGEKLEGIHGMKAGGAVTKAGKSLPKFKDMGALGLKCGGSVKGYSGKDGSVVKSNAAKDAFSNAKIQAEMMDKARSEGRASPKPKTTEDKSYSPAPKSVMGEDVDGYRRGGCAKMARGGLAKANGKAIRGKTKGRFV